MKKLILTFCLTTLALAGCSGEQADPEQTNQTDQTDANETNASTKNETNGNKQGNEPTQNQTLTIEQVKEQLKVGMTQEEIVEILGESYTEVSSAKDNTPMWRYDLGATADYSFEGPNDAIDMEALESGDLELILFINWNEEEQVSDWISAYYVNEADGKIYEFRIFPDGGERENPIT